MKKDKLLELGLDEEMATKVEALSSEELRGYIPKARLDEVIGERNTLKSTLAERDTQLETLKASAGDVTGLREQITQLQEQNKTAQAEYEAQINSVKISAAVDAAVAAAKGKNAKAIKALLDLEKAKIGEDGKVEGLDTQIETLRKAEDSAFLFESEKTPKMKGAKPGEGNNGSEGGTDKSKMTYEELAEFLDQNPDYTI